MRLRQSWEQGVLRRFGIDGSRGEGLGFTGEGSACRVERSAFTGFRAESPQISSVGRPKTTIGGRGLGFWQERKGAAPDDRLAADHGARRRTLGEVKVGLARHGGECRHRWRGRGARGSRCCNRAEIRMSIDEEPRGGQETQTARVLNGRGDARG